MEFFRNELSQIIDNMSDSNLITLHNDYCEEVGYTDDRIFYYEEVNDFTGGLSATEIIETYGDIANCDYWHYNGYGNAEPYDK